MGSSVPPGTGPPHRCALPIPIAAPAYPYGVTTPAPDAVNAAAGCGVLDVLWLAAGLATVGVLAAAALPDTS